ncbi:hypothetical protein BOX15_Mlig028288g1 [Macrostomum lignano]|uniref:Uncharacterized protein n=2 Tax=Macrostomum lignano TaxID=282301 RepID=A0A267DEA7_9PLAT|nr:hypothetical protein BOX15_Mlig028288g1 [Macrostomum lignano]
MGRGTAIVRYGSALHSRRLPGPSTQRLFGWLEAQLDMRGIDPAVYSRYLISLLQLDDAEFERSEVSDQESDSAAGVKRPGRKSRRRRQQQLQQQQQATLLSDSSSEAAIGLASGVSSRKRAEAVQCLQSACNDPYELDELIDELCYRLRRLNAATGGAALQPNPKRLPQLAEEEVGSPGAGGEFRFRVKASAINQVEDIVDGISRTVVAAAAGTADEDSGATIDVTDSGQASTPEELAAPAAAATEDYVCAFPALAEALRRDGCFEAAGGSASRAANKPIDGSGRYAGSAWARGPPLSLQHQSRLPGRRLHRRQRRVVASCASTAVTTDEGFLEGDEYLGDEELEEELEADEKELDEAVEAEEEDEDGDDAVSVTSEGSEILQLVSHILHSFNREIEDELASAAAAAPASSSSKADPDRLLLNRLSEPLSLDLPDSEQIIGAVNTNCGLLTGMSLMEDEAELLSDHDFDNLPSQEEELLPQALLDIDDIAADAPSDQGSVSSTAAASVAASVSASSSVSVAKPPTVAMATGIVALPANELLGRMAQWTQLDRLRCQMWSRKPVPPKPDQKQQQQQTSPTPVRRQPMTPLEKSKRACSFLLRGRCKKEDCEFAHDLNRVICKFWSAGECFKGDTCPFLHGNPAESEAED